MNIYRQIFVTVLCWTLFPCLHASPLPGQIVGWGDNEAGQASGMAHLGWSNGIATINDHILTNVVAIDAGTGHQCLALKSDGTVLAWGGFELPNWPPPAGLRDVKSIASGFDCSLALKSNGVVVGWGDVRVPDDLTNVAAVTRSRIYLKTDGTVASWGLSPARGGYARLVINKDGSKTACRPDSPIPKDLSNVVAIASGIGGLDRYLALKKDGTVVTWGEETDSPPPGLNNVMAIAVGTRQSLALKTDGTVVQWGAGQYDQTTGTSRNSSSNSPSILNNLVRIKGQILSNVVAIAAGGIDSTPASAYSLALKSDGTVVAWGEGCFQETNVPKGLSNVVAISAGPINCLALQKLTLPSGK